MSHLTDEQAEERAGAMLDVLAIPRDVLPDGRARDVLTVLASTIPGVEVYRSAAGHWNCWFERLAGVRPDHNGRVELATWQADWRGILAEMGQGGAA